MRYFIIFPVICFSFLFLFDLKADDTQPSPIAEISNNLIHLELHTSGNPQSSEWWLNIFCDSEKDFIATMVGDFNDQEKAQAFRKKHSLYYPFQQGRLQNIKRTEAQDTREIVFRVSNETGHWIDSKVFILPESPFAIFKVVDKSHPELEAHWRIEYQLENLQEIVTDKQASEISTESIKAKDAKGKCMRVTFNRFCAVFSPENDKNNHFLCLMRSIRNSVTFVRTAGLKTFYMNAPFALYETAASFTRDPHSIAHVAEGKWQIFNKQIKQYQQSQPLETK